MFSSQTLVTDQCLCHSEHQFCWIWLKHRGSLVHFTAMKHLTAPKPKAVRHASETSFQCWCKVSSWKYWSSQKIYFIWMSLKIHTETTQNLWAKLFPNIHSSWRHVRLKVQQFHQASGLEFKPTCVMLRFQGIELRVSLVRMLKKNKNAGIKCCIWPFLNLIFYREFIFGAKLTTLQSE